MKGPELKDLKAAITKHSRWDMWRAENNGRNSGDLSKSEALSMGRGWGLLDDAGAWTTHGQQLRAKINRRGRTGGTAGQPAPAAPTGTVDENGNTVWCEGCGEAPATVRAEHAGLCQACADDEAEMDEADANAEPAEPAEPAELTTPSDDPIEQTARGLLARIGTADFAGFKADLHRILSEAKAEAEEAAAKLAKAEQAAADALAAAAAAKARPTLGQDGTPLAYAPTVLRTAKAGELIKGLPGWSRDVPLALCDGAASPPVDPHYSWPAWSGLALALVSKGRTVMFSGPAGTGKTSWAEQLAAKTGRPFTHINLTKATEAPDLLGQFMPNPSTGFAWTDGPLTAAIRTPHTVILLDEISHARPGLVAFLLQLLGPTKAATLPSREVVTTAPGVNILLADNTDGTGDPTGHYPDRHAMDRALLDRIVAQFRADYLTPARMAAVIEAKTGASAELARTLADFSAMTQRGVTNGDLTHALGLRRLLAWAEALLTGAPSAECWEATVCGAQVPDDREHLEQMRATAFAHGTLEALAAGQPVTPRNPVAPEFDAMDMEGA